MKIGFRATLSLAAWLVCGIAPAQTIEESQPIIWFAMIEEPTKLSWALSQNKLPIEDPYQGVGGTALFWAAMHGKALSIEILLSFGANPVTTGPHGVTPLQALSCSGMGMKADKERGWKALIRAGAPVDQQDDYGKTVFDYAPKNMHDSLRQLAAQVQANKGSHKARLAEFMGAVRGNDLLAVKKFLEAGFPSNTQDDVGNSAIHYALHSGHFSVAEALVEWHASLNVANKQGETPLFFAILADSTVRDRAVQWCLSHGARTELKNAQGIAPADFARSLGLQSIAATMDQAASGREKRVQ